MVKVTNTKYVKYDADNLGKDQQEVAEQSQTANQNASEL